MLNGIAKRLNDGFLSHKFLKTLGAIFSIQGHVFGCHKAFYVTTPTDYLIHVTACLV